MDTEEAEYKAARRAIEQYETAFAAWDVAQVAREGYGDRLIAVESIIEPDHNDYDRSVWCSGVRLTVRPGVAEASGANSHWYWDGEFEKAYQDLWDTVTGHYGSSKVQITLAEHEVEPPKPRVKLME